MLACVDVDYRADQAVAACVLFRAWSEGVAHAQHVARISEVEEYVPGQFYKRELPCLMAVLALVTEALDAVLVDGHVWLRDENDPGLGAHLYNALNRAVPVVGVAKSPFRDGKIALAVTRGGSAQPLYVTAVGTDPRAAAASVAAMHGEHRIPTLLRAVDQLCRRA